MHRPRGLRGRRLEALVLALGLASSALLAAAGLAPFSDPELAGRAAFAEQAGRVEDAVAAEWRRMLAEPALSEGELVRWTAAEGALTATLPVEAAPSEPEPQRSSFEVLLGEAQRLEAAGEAAAALQAALEALDKAAPVARKAVARLAAIRTARALEDCVSAAGLWLSASAELDGSEVCDGVPSLAACALAASPCLDQSARSAAQELVVAAWTAGRLALGAGPMRSVLCERVAGLDPGSEASRRLLAFEKARELEALARASPARQLPPRPEDASWHLQSHSGPGELLAWRADGADGVVAVPVSPDPLIDRLRARVEQSELLPAGFRLDFARPGHAVEGERVRSPRALAGGPLGFELRHLDPAGAARAQGGRLVLVRIALLAVAGLTAGASWATFRALRRGRRLAEMKSAFVASVSHELRTPLASILMLAENLEGGRVADEAGRARYHGLIRREAERLRQLVADVLDFSRLERGQSLEMRRESVELSEFCASLRDEARAWAQRHAFDLRVDLEPAQGQARLDPEALRRAVENLLDNARKHSGEGAAALSIAVRRGVLELAVEDAGRGVAPELARTVFEPFVRAAGENGAPGAGLGLAIVRGIAREHGGDVGLAAPAAGRGARFQIRIPLDPTREVAPARA